MTHIFYPSNYQELDYFSATRLGLLSIIWFLHDFLSFFLYVKGKLYLFDLVIGAMKEITIFIRSEDLPKVTEILSKHNIGGLAFYEVNARGRTKLKEVPEMVRAYQTGKKVTAEHEKRTKVETIVPDSSANQLVDDLVNIRLGTESHGMIFVKEAVNAHEIGTKESGEVLLTSKK
jgi:nitrogen regulatory protein P-II 1